MEYTEWYEPALKKMAEVVGMSPFPDIGVSVLGLFQERPIDIITKKRAQRLGRKLGYDTEEVKGELDWLVEESCLKKYDFEELHPEGLFFYVLEGKPDMSFMGPVSEMFRD